MKPETSRPASHVFHDVHMSEPLCVPLVGGEAVVFSRRGPEKGENQDSAACFALEAGGVLVVADGLGGQPAAAAAARIAIECVGAALARDEGEGGVARAAILDAFEEANRQVLELGVGAGTTLAAVDIFVDTLRPYHVGDSAVLVVGQRGRLKLQTLSHSPVGYAVEAGVLDGEAALRHDERHLVSNVVGSPGMRIDMGSPLALARRDTVLVATDGLLDNLVLPEIVDEIRVKPLVQVARTLAEVAQTRMQGRDAEKPSKPDDLTFILYRRA